MCFKNLPVEFDASGRAFLRADAASAYATDAPLRSGVATLPSHDKIRELVRKNGHIKEYNIDPVTRVAGALAFHTVTDLQERKVLETNSIATLFRGYEIILKGRDPHDAIFISSRACGVCGGVHSVASVLALEMAFGIKPPPLGVLLRNLGLSMEFMYDHPLHMFLLAGPDYSQQIVQGTNPEIWERAVRTEARFASVHGFRTIGDIMTGLNPLTGSLYLEALGMTRVAREAYVVLHGKYPHPQTIVPGGVSTTVSLTTLQEYYNRLVRFFDYSKKVATLWDDIFDFFYDVNPDYKKVGARPANLIDTGLWDDPDAYDASYKYCAEWGDRRWATPGCIVNGELRTTSLQNLNIGLEEFVTHSFYEEWAGSGNGSTNGHAQRFATDSLGAPLSPYHMWNKDTIPKPGKTSWKEKYTWDTAPRWDRFAMETGPYSRMWNTAVARKIRPNPFIEATGHSLKMNLPKGELPAMELEWHVPKHWGAFERNRGRAYAMAFNALVSMNDWLKAMELLRAGKTDVATKYDMPRKGTQVGVGFGGAGRGFLTHHAVITDGAIENYQILTPSTFMASPKDPFGAQGPYEEAVLNTPILENFEKPENFTGIDILRAIRSFDPCMPCTTHIFDQEKLVVSREVNTCGCGLDE
jgi:hydrogenase large subunit